MSHYKPFVCVSTGSPLLVWAKDKRHAKRLLHKQRSDVPQKDLDVQPVAPESIVLPPEMLGQGSLPELQGQVRMPTNRWVAEGGFIVPDFLKGKRRAVIYTRVSTKQQVKNTSLDTQREKCEAFAEVAGLIVEKVYVEVGGRDEYATRRELQSALEDLEQGRAEVLLVAYFDRLVGDEVVQQLIFQRIWVAKVSFISCDMQAVDGAEHHLALESVRSTQGFKQVCVREWGLLS